MLLKMEGFVGGIPDKIAKIAPSTDPSGSALQRLYGQ